MTREDAAELLEIFQTGDQETLPLNRRAMVHAYLEILGSLRD